MCDSLVLPPGVIFRPSDDELIRYYLMNKTEKNILPPNPIHSLNFYEFGPDFLADRYKAASGKNEWYFFSKREKKHKGGSRPNRIAGDGYWKATAAEKPVRNEIGQVIGFRRSLVYYGGKPGKDTKTNWLMQEYTLKNMRADDWVVCKMYKKMSKKMELMEHVDQQAENIVPILEEEYNDDDINPALINHNQNSPEGLYFGPPALPVQEEALDVTDYTTEENFELVFSDPLPEQEQEQQQQKLNVDYDDNIIIPFSGGLEVPVMLSSEELDDLHQLKYEPGDFDEFLRDEFLPNFTIVKT